MNRQSHRCIPQVFFEWITFLAQAVPIRSAPTFIELLVGSMLTEAGFVTQAWLAIDMKRHWTSYFKWLEQGQWSWVALGRQLGRLVEQWFPDLPKFLVIDDTVVLRHSTRAPDSRFHHQHGSKANRPTFVRGQGWVTLSVALANRAGSAWSIPLLSRLSRTAGNSSKLTAAKVLLRAMHGIIPNATLLVDSWYMRKTLIVAALQLGHHVIGPVRRDTALYDVPVRTGKRGRPRTYGTKYTPERVDALPEHQTRTWLYGKHQLVHYRSVVANARFLGGRLVRVVWVRFEDPRGTPSKARLLLTTDASLDALTVLEHYARRWSIDPMFHQLKNAWGWNQTWQQTRQVLHRWVQMLALGYAIPRLLAILAGQRVQALSNLTPWRAHQPITSGRVRLGLNRILGHVRIRDWWDPKSRKFSPPEGQNEPSKSQNLKQAA